MFAHDADYLHYRHELGEAASKHGCALHTYVLMANHLHLLLTPNQAQEKTAFKRQMNLDCPLFLACTERHCCATIAECRLRLGSITSLDSSRYDK